MCRLLGNNGALSQNDGIAGLLSPMSAVPVPACMHCTCTYTLTVKEKILSVDCTPVNLDIAGVILKK